MKKRPETPAAKKSEHFSGRCDTTDAARCCTNEIPVALSLARNRATWYNETMEQELTKNALFEAQIDGFTSQGEGVCRLGGRAVFVAHALPGEVWRVRIVKVTKTAVWGRGEQLLAPSPLRREPSCPVFGRCGGCSALHMDYALELRSKLDRVNDALRRIGGLDLRAERIVPAPSREGYRNKAVYNFAPGPVCGFYRPRSHDVVETPRCLLQPPAFDAAARALLDWMKRTGVPAFDERAGKGAVRRLFLRRTSAHFAACIESARPVPPEAVSALRAACPDLTGVLECRNGKPGNVVLNGPIRTLWGRDTVEETLCGARLTLSPLAFFQVNTAQAQRLYTIAGDYAQPSGKTVLDLYCGAGSIGLAVARDAARLIGSDIVADAVANARRNAAANGVANAEYICGDAGDVAARLAQAGLRPDVIITDPPRKGMDEAVLSAIVSMGPERLVYVSCDPATLARDLKRLAALGYTPRHATAVDMFPGTHHVETCVLLSKLKVEHYIEVDLDLDELDLTSVETKASYREIKEYVQEHFGLRVSNLYIAQVKRKYGIIERGNYNLPKSDDAKQPQCPPEKENAIRDALRHFRMIEGGNQ